MPHVEFAYLGYPTPVPTHFLADNLLTGRSQRLRSPVRRVGAYGVLSAWIAARTPASSPLASLRSWGLDMLTLKRNFTAGVGSSANATAYETIEVDLGSEVRFRAYAGFSLGLNALGLGLLGQAGFFEKFDVCFHHARRIFTIGRR
jgi:hypothetical protein